MSIRTTITLEEDVVARVKAVSKRRGASFRETLNDLLRIALISLEQEPTGRTLRIKPVHMGYNAGLNHDDIESLLDYGEGTAHR